MLNFAIGLLAGIVATSVVAIAYHKVIVADYQKAANTVGVVFDKIEGKLTAFRKG